MMSIVKLDAWPFTHSPRDGHTPAAANTLSRVWLLQGRSCHSDCRHAQSKSATSGANRCNSLNPPKEMDDWFTMHTGLSAAAVPSASIASMHMDKAHMYTSLPVL
jgi:hypothetical protein